MQTGLKAGSSLHPSAPFAKRDAMPHYSLVKSQAPEHLFAFKKPQWKFSFCYPGTKVAFSKSGAKALRNLTHKSPAVLAGLRVGRKMQ